MSDLAVAGSSSSIVANANFSPNSSTCSTKVEPIRLEQDFTIENFSPLLKLCKPGHCLRSHVFRHDALSEVTWQLCLYPAGKRAENEGFVSLFLKMFSTAPNREILVSAEYKFHFLDDTRLVKFVYVNKGDFHAKPPKCAHSWGLRNIPRQHVVQSLRQDGSLLVHCEIEFLPDRCRISICPEVVTKKATHQPKMEAQKSISQDDSSSRGAQASQNSRSESNQSYVSSLVHACQCRDDNCQQLSCHKMKRVVKHSNRCKSRQLGPCIVCKNLKALCYYHAKDCQEQKCMVPFCPNVRQKLAKHAARLKKKREQILRRLTGVRQQQAQPAIQNLIEAMENGLVISGKQKEKMDLHRGFVSRTFKRRFVLSKNVDPATIACKLTNKRVLYIEARKKSLESPEERAVPIQVGTAHSAIAQHATGASEKNDKN